MGIVARARTSAIVAIFVFAVCGIAQAADDAAAHYRRGVELGEAAEKANIFRRASLARQTRIEFEQAVALDPNFIDARVALVEYYLRAPHFLGGSEQKAIAQAHEIMKRDAAEGHRAFAQIYEHQKQHDKAVTELAAAEALDRVSIAAKGSQ